MVKLLRTLSSSARLKSYTKGRETKRGELKLIEKTRIPLEKSNFIPFNFAEDVINNDHLQLHPTRKSQSMSFESFIFQGCYRAEFHHQGPAVQRLDNAIHWINRYPVDSAVRLLNSYPLIYPLDSVIHSFEKRAQIYNKGHSVTEFLFSHENKVKEITITF